MADSGWQTQKHDGDSFIGQPKTVTVHSKIIGGVLCRWWGDGPEPEGVALLDSLSTHKNAVGEAARMMQAIKRTWGPETHDDGADGELWNWLNDFVRRHGSTDSGETK